MCDFVVFTISYILVTEVTKNVKFIDNMLDKLDQFYNAYFKVHLLQQHFFRNSHCLMQE